VRDEFAAAEGAVGYGRIVSYSGIRRHLPVVDHALNIVTGIWNRSAVRCLRFRRLILHCAEGLAPRGSYARGTTDVRNLRDCRRATGVALAEELLP